MLSKLNYQSLHEILKNRLFLYELPRRKLRGLDSFLSVFTGNIDGISASSIANILRNVSLVNATRVFVDGSNYGSFISCLKRQMPDVEVITFFHNVELRFFWGAFCSQPSFRSFGVLLANWIAERKSVKNSDKIVCLSNRDSLLLKKIYGRAASALYPMVLNDTCPPDFLVPSSLSSERFALFVGGSFYANWKGIRWFVHNVVPHISIPVIIVGRGFELLRSDLERSGKVSVVGAVENLSDWYHQAHFVIAPIFDGSGMKTKVAEALMYGKKIVGTAEAFSGYEDFIDQAGWICHSVQDFVAAIEEASESITMSTDPILRNIYESNYSKEAAIARMSSLVS